MQIVSTHFAKTWFGNVNMTPDCDVTNTEYRVTVTSIRHCSILQFGGGHTIKQSPRASPGLCMPLSKVAEMSGLWNFLIRVQSWSDEIESDPVLFSKFFENHWSDPVLIHQCKIMYFYFASCSKRTTGAILPSAKWLVERKIVAAVLLPHEAK